MGWFAAPLFVVAVLAALCDRHTRADRSYWPMLRIIWSLLVLAHGGRGRQHRTEGVGGLEEDEAHEDDQGQEAGGAGHGNLGERESRPNAGQRVSA
jgi:hypothetical protein